jgi:lipoprotein signal peptidase
MVLMLDVLTKTLAVGLIRADRATTAIGGGVTLVVERNAGAALSIGQDYTWVFTAMLLAVIGALLWYGRRIDPGPVAVGDWLVFNFADVGIACGVATLAWQSLFPARRPAPRQPLSDPPPMTWSWATR